MAADDKKTGKDKALEMGLGGDPLLAALRAAASEKVDADMAAHAARKYIRKVATKAAAKAVKKVAKAEPGAAAAAKPKATVSPLAPKGFPETIPVAGVTLTTALSGTRYKNRDDFLMVAMEPGTTAAGVFTTSKAPSAPVDWDRKAVENGAARLLLVNAGNANAFTGKLGDQATRAMAKAGADLMRCRQGDVFLASTGVIGQALKADAFIEKMEEMKEALAPGGWEAAAKAIMTTDTFPKAAARTAKIDDATVNIVGIAKGSGMIAPDMATMLAFVFTDASIPADVLQTLLLVSVRDSFNAITVDGDTSTSDTALLFATGRGEAHGPVRRPGEARLKDFREALDAVMTDLAQQIVRDGEGATKFVTITVTGAENQAAAKKIALSIANSPLVKTAIAGEDPNWGRIVMAVGKAGEAAERDRLKVSMCGHLMADKGELVPDYDETPVAKAMKGKEISIEVDVGVGRGTATVWTCDLTHRYIDINADYRS